jgi:hypothetical protein
LERLQERIATTAEESTIYDDDVGRVDDSQSNGVEWIDGRPIFGEDLSDRGLICGGTLSSGKARRSKGEDRDQDGQSHFAHRELLHIEIR